MSAAVAVHHANYNEGIHAHHGSIHQHLGNNGFDNVSVSPTSQYPPPNPLSRNDAPKTKVPIPHKNSVGSKNPSLGAGGDAAMTAQASGPMSTNVVVPQRPKPGRKPLETEQSADRRRTQNRLAQRNFRDKRQQKLAEVTRELEECRKAYEVNISRAVQQNEEDRQRHAVEMEAVKKIVQSRDEQIRRMEEQLEAIEKQLKTSQKQLEDKKTMSALGSFRAAPTTTPTAIANYSSDQVQTPTHESYEIDFTTYGQNRSNQMDYQMDANEDRCGFCTDLQNCACSNKHKPEPVEPPITMPGGCADCLKDPARAQACREMAAGTSMSTHTSATHGAVPLLRRSCSSMIDEFNKYGQRTSSISNLFGGRLHAYPSSRGAGYDFEEKEAAEVLSELCRQSTKHEPQKTPVDPRKDSGVSP